MKFSSRLQEVKRVHWHMVRKLINAKEAQGVKTISLASGNPDLPTPPTIVEAACQALRDPTYHPILLVFRHDTVKPSLPGTGSVLTLI